MAGDEVDKGTWGMVMAPITHTKITVLGSLKPTNEFNLWQSCHFDHGWLGQKVFNSCLQRAWREGYEWAFMSSEHPAP